MTPNPTKGIESKHEFNKFFIHYLNPTKGIESSAYPCLYVGNRLRNPTKGIESDYVSGLMLVYDGARTQQRELKDYAISPVDEDISIMNPTKGIER